MSSRAWRGPARPFPTSTLVERQEAQHSTDAYCRPIQYKKAPYGTANRSTICVLGVTHGSPKCHAAVTSATNSLEAASCSLERAYWSWGTALRTATNSVFAKVSQRNMTSTASPPQHAIDLHTLGHLDLRPADGIEVRSALAQGKRMALLSYLAVAQPRGFHRRDTLVGLFWPETDQRHARAALRQALHFLRQSLGRDVVLNRGPEEIGVDFSVLSCDVVLFERYLEAGDVERAVELYGGPLLRGFFINDAPEFEKWLGSERDRLAQLYADALRSLAEDAETNGDRAAAARWWKRLAQHDPYSSEVAWRAIAAMEATGDRAGAITHAHSHVDAVRTDLEVEPDDAVLELVEKLREQPSRSISAGGPLLNHAMETSSIDTADIPNSNSGSAARPWLRYRNLLGAVLLLVVCAGALIGLPEGGSPVPVPTISLAVLPFENLGSQNGDYFVVGLAEDIVCRLAGMQRLALVGPNDGGLDSPYEAEAFSGASLEADFLLRGLVERVLNADGSTSVRMTPSLTRVSDGAQVWSETVTNELSQVFDGQIRIVESIVRVLNLAPLSTERDWLRATPTNDPDAFDLFLLGNDNLRRASNDIQAARTAVELFERAIARDPTFVLAFAKLAIAHTSMFWWNHDRTPQRLAAARAAADNAVRLRPDMPHCHLALGWYYYWGERDYDRALRHFELARTNWPGVSDVLVLVAGIRRRQGDFERALENHHEAAAADPSCATCLAGAGFTHLMLREFRTAEHDAQRALTIAPDFSYARRVAAMARLNLSGDTAGARAIMQSPTNIEQVLRFSGGHWSALPRVLGEEYDSIVLEHELESGVTDSASYYLVKAEVAERTGLSEMAAAHYDSARVMLEQQIAEFPDDPRLHSRLGIAYAGMGMRSEALRAGTEATRLRPVSDDAVDGPLALEMLARIYTMLGDADTAIDRLEMLLSIPSHLSAELIRLDPVWAHLGHHDRFVRLTR